jgi:hypothetical protein
MVMNRRIFLVGIILLGLFAPVLLYVSQRIVSKLEESTITPSSMVMGTSGGERLFHIRYAISIPEEQPIAMLLGIGPGRYFEYAAKTGLFPDTVTPQVMLVEWGVGYGILGWLFLLLLLFAVAKRSLGNYGIFGLAGFIGLIVANSYIVCDVV